MVGVGAEGEGVERNPPGVSVGKGGVGEPLGVGVPLPPPKAERTVCVGSAREGVGVGQGEGVPPPAPPPLFVGFLSRVEERVGVREEAREEEVEKVE